MSLLAQISMQILVEPIFQSLVLGILIISSKNFAYKSNSRAFLKGLSILCDNYIDFKHNLLKTNDKKYFDEEYEIDKKKFINFCIGRNELENFNIEFLNLIKNKF